MTLTLSIEFGVRIMASPPSYDASQHDRVILPVQRRTSVEYWCATYWFGSFLSVLAIFLVIHSVEQTFWVWVALNVVGAWVILFHRSLILVDDDEDEKARGVVR